jgi:hypothetical protein
MVLGIRPAFSLEVKPFTTKNLSPIVQGFGLPVIYDSDILRPGRIQGSFGLDITNNFSDDIRGNEEVLFDGETYRYEMVVRRGLSESVELGVVLPFIRQSGGIFDGFIESWHDFFGLPQGGRLSAPKDRLRYSYTENGVTRFNLTQATDGLGDISFIGGYQLFRDNSIAPRSAAIRFSFKLPTGNADRLRGSGSTDLAVYFAGSDGRTMDFLNMTWYGDVGILYATDGNLLEEKQRNVVGFASLGIGWKPFEKALFKMQFDAHTPFYKVSSLDQLSTSAIQVVLGGTLELFAQFFLDIGVIEDIVLDTVPDVTFHFDVRKSF